MDQPYNLQTFSLYNLIAEKGSDLIVTHSKETMQEISYQIENGIVASGERAPFYAGFQRLSFFEAQVARYQRIAECCGDVVVIGIADWEPPPIPGVTYVGVAEDSALAREWFLVFDTPSFYTSLLAEDTTGFISDDPERQFRALWTFREEQVFRAHLATAALLGRQDEVAAFTRTPPVRDYNAQRGAIAQMVDGVVSDLEGRNSELRQAYRRLEAVNDENARLQALVRRYIAGSTWDEAARSVRDGGGLPQVLYRPLAVLFTDIVDFTGFTEQHTPQEMAVALNGYFWWASRLVYQHGGEINKYTGDGILAVFDSSAAALAAGRDLLDALAGWNQQRALLDLVPLATRMGLHSGRVIVASVGGPERQDRTVLGDVVNTAARLQQVAPPDTLLVSEAAYQAAGAPPDAGARRAVSLRGKRDLLFSYEFRANTDLGLPSSLIPTSPIVRADIA